MDKSIDQLCQDLTLAAYARGTCDRYVRVAELLGERFGKPLIELSRDELRVFVQERAERPVSASTKRLEIAGLRFLYGKTLGCPDQVSFLVFPKKCSALPVVLTIEEVHALINAIRRPLYQALAMVLYGAGLRLGEALALQVQDIDGARGVIHVRHGKGNKPREAKLSSSLYEWLRSYWARVRPPQPYLFASAQSGKPAQPECFRIALRSAATQAWIKKRVTPHVLRHSFATHLLEHGTDVRVVGALLGHSSLTSTMRYTRVTAKLVRETPSPLDLLPHRRW